jgi:transposase-like protein
VGSRHFENKARRSWWSVHVAAWRKSGLTRTVYCRQHRLTKSTFDRWLHELDAREALRAKERMRRKRHRQPQSDRTRNRAVQAFWAMHVEAMTWCGMGVRDYAAAHHLSVHSLRRWRDLIDSGEVTIDWRARLHPSARPRISTGASSAATTPPAESDLTRDEAVSVARDGRASRRSFSDADKITIVLECEQPGVSVAAVARHHGIATSMIFRWRVQFGYGREERTKLATVRLRGDCVGAAAVLSDLMPTPDGMAAFDLPDGRRVFAPAGADPETVRQHVTGRESAS